jgi:hypothetical protein
MEKYRLAPRLPRVTWNVVQICIIADLETTLCSAEYYQQIRWNAKGCVLLINRMVIDVYTRRSYDICYTSEDGLARSKHVLQIFLI